MSPHFTYLCISGDAASYRLSVCLSALLMTFSYHLFVIVSVFFAVPLGFSSVCLNSKGQNSFTFVSVYLGVLLGFKMRL